MSNNINELNTTGIPVRSPHHSASLKGIIGGGRPITPGEVSLSHRGYLILDELPEFKRNVLESLRQIMQNYKVHISHGFDKSTLPAVNTILATMNPCPSDIIAPICPVRFVDACLSKFIVINHELVDHFWIGFQ